MCSFVYLLVTAVYLTLILRQLVAINYTRFLHFITVRALSKQFHSKFELLCLTQFNRTKADVHRTQRETNTAKGTSYNGYDLKIVTII